MQRVFTQCKRSLLFFVFYLVSFPSYADPVQTVLDFESLFSLDSVTTQFPGVTFSNAAALTAGDSLNEVDFPPASGTNVVVDDGAAISISFDSLVSNFSGLFTYLVPVVLDAYDEFDNLVLSATSAFSDNTNFFGEFGSAPNELLSLNYAAGISRVTISGDPFGYSFVMDDAKFVTAAPALAVSAPDSISLFLFGGVLLMLVLRSHLCLPSSADRLLAR